MFDVNSILGSVLILLGFDSFCQLLPSAVSKKEPSSDVVVNVI